MQVCLHVQDCCPADRASPLGLGMRLREVHRAPGGKQLASLVEVFEYEPDRVFALRMLEGALRSSPDR